MVDQHDGAEVMQHFLTQNPAQHGYRTKKVTCDFKVWFF